MLSVRIRTACATAAAPGTATPSTNVTYRLCDYGTKATETNPSKNSLRNIRLRKFDANQDELPAKRVRANPRATNVPLRPFDEESDNNDDFGSV
jgi:hypothetical protein